MGFTNPDKFTYLNTFVMELAQRCSDNGGPTVSIKLILQYSKTCPKIYTAKPIVYARKFCMMSKMDELI